MRLPAILLSFALALGLPGAAQPRPVQVAVAAAGDLRGVLEELKTGFEAGHPGIQLQLSFGASGSLTAQIQQGAPFDLFLSADEGFPRQLQKAGLVRDQGMFPYATGSLTLWVRKDLALDPARDGWNVLLSPVVKKISTANPQVAPYGRAAEAALRKVGFYDRVQSRLVFADNIAQAAQFLQAGSAEAGLISTTQANNPALRQTGVLWTVPADTHPPLRQAGVILKRSQCPDQAQALRAYLTGPAGQAVLARYGYSRP
ncbi:MAG: molybdate ABC transporter substrate-binding protein [Holophaga sp.]|nr:molybdate ABC transporter substrate-binding protein [Holophaga sp.]